MKESILRKLSDFCQEPVSENKPLTELDPITYADPLSKGIAMVKQVGGEVEVNDQPDPLVWIRRKFGEENLMVLKAGFLVAENGALWINASDFDLDRSAPFLAEHLVILLHPAQVVHNMHEAYLRVKNESPGYHLFMSGPSKTADIEQALVMGAQGPRKMTLWISNQV